jgi:hypothetical protein
MALSASCTDRVVRFQDDNVSTAFNFDSLMDTVVTNPGLLLASTITVRRLSGASQVSSYTFTGTGAECLGIEAAIVSCMRDMNGSAGYSDWQYP